MILTNELFIAGLGLACVLALAWGFRHLPQERWQFLAAVPVGRQADGSWRGLNLTWYGLLLASAQTLAVALLILLMASYGTPWPHTVGFVAALLAFCYPASRLLAGLIEKKAHTFTVGGASLTGIVAAPLFAGLGNLLLGGSSWSQGPWTPLPLFAAMMCVYALGEGLGRLACISFGCCYGRSLASCPPALQGLFARAHFVFHGSTKKIAYASGLEGQPVIPVQALTAVILLAASLAGTYLFLRGAYLASLLVAGLTTQLWRAISEFMRADYRGQGRISVYQWFALAATACLLAMAVWLPDPPAALPDLSRGLAALWSPGPLLLLQALWLFAFLYYGHSRVTSANLSFKVLEKRV